MTKKLVSVVCALMMVGAMASAGMAASLKCTVDAVEGEKVTMTCKKADKLKAGDKVKVRGSKGAAVEGC